MSSAPSTPSSAAGSPASLSPAASSPPSPSPTEEVFEIVDYTNASPWETLVSDVERAFRNWGLASSVPATRMADHSGQRSVEVSMLGRVYLLEYHAPAPGLLGAGAETAISKDMYRRVQEGGFENDVPPAMSAMLSTTTDFDRSAHSLGQRYGLQAFVTLQPAAAGYSSKVSQSESRLLLGGLAVAVGSTGCTLPVFVQVNEAHRKTFLGYSTAQDTHTNFDGIWLPVPPPAYSHLSGLCELFRSKLQGPDGTAQPKPWISARFTYGLRDWFDDWDSAAGVWDPSRPPSSVPQAGDTSEKYGAPVRLPCGSVANPVQCLWWAASWRRFREDSVMDNAVYSELSPLTAPLWTLSVEWKETAPDGILTSILRSFVDACGSASTVDDILGERAFADEDELTEKKQDQARAKLDALSRSRGMGLTGASDLLKVGQVGKRIGSKIGSMVERTVEKTVSTVSHARRGGDRRSRGLSEADLDGILRYMFVDVSAAEAGTATEAASEMIGARTVPPGSLLSGLAVYLGLVNRYSGGLRGVALLWSEFVLEVRWHWEHLKPLPLVCVDGGKPDMKWMLLHQKLQMINCCIERQLRRNQLLKKRHAGGDGQDHSGEANYSSEEDEFYLAPEDEETAMQRVEALKKSHASGPDNTSASAPHDEPQSPASQPQPQGVKSVSELRLLSGGPMHVPITQDPGPMTEDMMDEELELMTQMGDSEQAAEMRTRMQSMTLKSDMSAFKAANPGCRLADFVRWHSPRDWILPDGEEDAGAGSLSERMSTEGSLWQELWTDAKATPVSRQMQLFDTTKQAERALSFLAAISPREFLWQLLPALLRRCHASLAFGALGIADNGADSLEALRHAATGYGRSIAEDQDRLQDIVEQFTSAERHHGRCQALFQLLGQSRLELSRRLLEGGEASIVEPDDRQFVQDIFKSANGSDRFDPDQREFIFRAVCPSPNETCRPVAHRMYCLLSDHNFRVDGGFSEDDSFRYSKASR